MMEDKSARIRGICVLSFFDGSVLLRVVLAWGLRVPVPR